MFEFSTEISWIIFLKELPQCSLFPFSFHSCGPFLYFGSNAASLKWFFSRRCFSWFSLDSKNFDRTLIWKVRMVRSLADRTFQLRSTGLLLLLDPRGTPFRRSWCCFEQAVVVRDAAQLGAELKGSIGEGPNHSNHSNRSNSFKIGIFTRKFKKFQKISTFSKLSAKFWQNFIKIWAKSVKRILKSEFLQFFAEKCEIFWRTFSEILRSERCKSM